MKKNIIFLFLLLILPSIVSACVDAKSILLDFFKLLSGASLAIFALPVIVLSFKKGGIYKGGLNIVLLIFLIIFLLSSGTIVYREYRANKERIKCFERCSRENPNLPCFCEPLGC